MSCEFRAYQVHILPLLLSSLDSILYSVSLCTITYPSTRRIRRDNSPDNLVRLIFYEASMYIHFHSSQNSLPQHSDRFSYLNYTKIDKNSVAFSLQLQTRKLLSSLVQIGSDQWSDLMESHHISNMRFLSHLYKRYTVIINLNNSCCYQNYFLTFFPHGTGSLSLIISYLVLEEGTPLQLKYQNIIHNYFILTIFHLNNIFVVLLSFVLIQSY